MAEVEKQNELPEEIIPQLFCSLNEISIVLLLIYSLYDSDIYPNIKILYKMIELGVEIMLTENNSPIQIPSDIKLQINLNDEVTELEINRISEALREHDGNQTKAAKALDLGRVTFIAKAKKYELV